MGPRDALLIMILLIASERNPTQVRLGETRALLEGTRGLMKQTGTPPGHCLLPLLLCGTTFSPITN